MIVITDKREKVIIDPDHVLCAQIIPQPEAGATLQESGVAQYKLVLFMPSCRVVCLIDAQDDKETLDHLVKVIQERRTLHYEFLVESVTVSLNP